MKKNDVFPAPVKDRKILMVGSDLSAKGGIVSVIRSYLTYDGWKQADITFLPTHIEGSPLKKACFFAKALLKICSLLDGSQYGIVHIHVSERGSFIRKAIILRIARHKKCKTVLHHHGAEFFEYYQNSGSGMKQFIGRSLALADLNLILSRRLIPEYQKISPNAQFQCLYNTVHTPEKNLYRSDAREFTMLGRLEERKGTFALLETLKAIDHDLAPDILFNLCGDGDIGKVRARIEELQLGHRIGHLGWAEGKTKDDILDRTMAHVLFSNNEGLPMSILETMGRGIVNIATNIAAIPEVITDRVTGFLVEAGDKEKLADALLEVSRCDSLRNTVSENSFRYISEHFSIESGAHRLEQIYSRLS